MLEAYIQNTILGYHSQHHNKTHHLGLFWQVWCHLGVQMKHGAIHHLGSILEGGGRGWVAHLCASFMDIKEN